MTRRFGITVGLYNREHWDELYKLSTSNYVPTTLPFVVGKYYTYNNEWGEEVSCGFQVLAQFLKEDEARVSYERNSLFLKSN